LRMNSLGRVEENGPQLAIIQGILRTGLSSS
jgi:hypothetical protein